MTAEKLSKIIKMAQGKIPADLVIKNCRVVDVISCSIVEGDIAISERYILGVGAYEGRNCIDAKGAFVTSGLIDAHVHIESSLCTPQAFAKMVLPLGTTSVVADPHEIANVCGVDGIEFMIASSKKVPLNFHFMFPSCVPATDFEDSGAVLDSSVIFSMLKDPEIFGLAEMMNSPGLLSCDNDVIEKLVHAINANKPIDGHGPMLDGKRLNAYAAAGVKTDHECVTVGELKDRLMRGMYVLLRQGSAAQNMEALLSGVTPSNARHCAFCTDDKHSGDIIKNGHINHNLKIAVKRGFDVFNAISMATVNAAECYGLKYRGLIAPGYIADLVLFDDLVDFNANSVFIDGKLVAQNGEALFEDLNTDANKIECENRYQKLYQSVTDTVNISPVSLENIRLQVKGDTARVMRLIKHDLVTEAVSRLVGTNNGYFSYRTNIDILKLVVVERHKASGKIGIGLIENYKLVGGAIATTIGHDSHNLIAVGDNDQDILLAIQTLSACGGGITMIKDNKVLDTLVLPIAGIMSDKSANWVSEKIDKMNEMAFTELSVNRDIDPFMTLSFLTLPVIPDIKLTPRGLFDVNKFEFVEISIQ